MKEKLKKLLEIKRNRIITFIAVFLIIAGLCIALRPWYIAWHFANTQKKMIATWNATSEFVEDTGSAGWQISVSVIGDEYVEVWEEDTGPSIDINYVINHMDGILTIDRIRLNVPIINKYTIKNLNISICSIVAANHMGQAGNYVLAGHKSRIRGRHFNRLLELRLGDLIVAENKEAKYTYKVTEVFSVTPLDTWVMENDGDKKLITLITCDYTTNPIGRLIVRGELIETEPAEASD